MIRPFGNLIFSLFGVLPITIPSFSSSVVGLSSRTASPAQIGEPSGSRKGSSPSESLSLSSSSLSGSEVSEFWLFSVLLLLFGFHEEVVLLG